jgi:hypothetical protein
MPASVFEDFEEQDSVDVSPDASDRLIAYAIHSRGDMGVTAEEAWAILYERYPDDPRFLLLNAYAELAETAVAGVWTPAYFLKKVDRILDGGSDAIHPHLKDLLGFAGNVLASAKGEDATKLNEVRGKVGAGPETKRDERAGLRLRRYEREVLKELHERTEGNKPLGVRRQGTPIAPAATDWASATADKSKPKKKYAATDRFERGELVDHPKFGVGVVTLTEPSRVSILFESGLRKLVSG